MVKSLRYDQKNHDRSRVALAVDRLWCTRHADADTNCHGHSAPNGYTASYGYRHACVDLPRAEPLG